MATPRVLPGPPASPPDDGFAPPAIDASPRIANPFTRFQTRAYWLSAMIRLGREANPAPRDVPAWFNR